MVEGVEKKSIIVNGVRQTRETKTKEEKRRKKKK